MAHVPNEKLIFELLAKKWKVEEAVNDNGI